MWEIIENLPGWAKITGLSIPILVIFLLILHAYGQKEAIELPSTLDEIKENVTQQTMKETTNSGVIIVKEFNEAGKSMAKDIKDPVAAKTVEWGMTFAGLMLAAYLILAVAIALYKAFGG